MPLQFDSNLKNALIIYTIITAIILIKKPRIIFHENMDLKLIVLSKDKKLSIPVLYVLIIIAALISFYIPRN